MAIFNNNGSVAEFANAGGGSGNSFAGGGNNFLGMISQLLQNPNFRQYLGNAGETISKGGTFAEAINPAEMIEQSRNQQVTNELLRQILEGGIKPTPKGQAGADSVTSQQTADGTRLTINVPSEENLNSYGTSVPIESQSSKPVGENGVPFLRALLNQ